MHYRYVIIIFTLICLSINITFADELSKNNVNKVSKKIILDKYTKALKLFKVKKYKESNKLLKQLYDLNIENVNINFYLGRTYFELKRYDDAILAYNRVLFQNSNSARVKFELGRTYFILKDFKEAKKFFQELKNDKSIKKNIKLVVGKFLKSIDSKTKKNVFNGMVLLGINYDSNVNNRAEDEIFNNVYIPEFDIYLDMNNTTKRINDWAHQEVGMLNHKYRYSDKILFKNDFMVFSKTMKNKVNSSKDIDLISYAFTASKNYKNNVLVDYSFFIDKLWIGDRSNQISYGIFPKFKYSINQKLNSNGSFKYQVKRNQLDSNQNSKYMELKYGLKYNYSPKVIPSVVSTITKENKIKGTLTTINKKSFNTKFSTTYMLRKNLSIAPMLSYKYTRYDDIDPNYLTRRRDKEYKLGVMNTYIYSSKLLVQFGGDYTKNISNIPVNQYSKHTISFNIIRPF